MHRELWVSRRPSFFNTSHVHQGTNLGRSQINGRHHCLRGSVYLCFRRLPQKNIHWWHGARNLQILITLILCVLPSQHLRWNLKKRPMNEDSHLQRASFEVPLFPRVCSRDPLRDRFLPPKAGWSFPSASFWAGPTTLRPGLLRILSPKRGAWANRLVGSPIKGLLRPMGAGSIGSIRVYWK